jgi:hypothetical protein
MSPLIEQLSILSVTGIMGDSKVDVAYTAIMYEKWKVRSKFDKYLPRNQFGHDVDFILLEFYVEGSHDWFTIPDKIKIGRYSTKEKAISIKIPMLKDVSGAVLSNDVQKVDNFLVNTFERVGELIMSSKALARLDFDFKKFAQDYQVFMQHLLDDSPK